MNHLDINDIKKMAEANDKSKLVLHFEGVEGGAVIETAGGILYDIERGHFTEDQFNSFGYCITLEEYKEEKKNQ